MHIGSAGTNFYKWNKISSNSILVSLDKNLKKEKITKNFKNIINKNVIISNKNSKSKFYITKDTDCSSLLGPNENIYKNWYGAHKFKIKKVVKTDVIEINRFLTKNKINYINWLVIDIQRMDLRVIKKLKENIKKNISIIDMDPGFEPFYYGADNIVQVFDYMNKYFEFDMNFGLNFKVKSRNLKFLEKKLLFLTNQASKIYSNINFINKYNDKRKILLKLINLISNNKILEAQELIDNNSKFKKSLSKIYSDINNYLFLQRNKLLLFFPFYYLKKNHSQF
jgi:FkbM family methyltransferase